MLKKNNQIKEINNSLNELLTYNSAYEKGDILISDAEFEILIKQIMNELCLSRVEFENTYFQNFNKKNKNYITHPSIIFRIDKIYNNESIIYEFEKKISTSDYIVLESKIDGIMVNLVFNNGLLIKSISRGDKSGGEDLNNIFKNINIPKKINLLSLIEIRGELFITNKIYLEKYSSFSSPRAALMSLISTINIDCEKYFDLEFFAYDLILSSDEHIIEDRVTLLSFLNELGFNTPLIKKLRLGEVNKYYDEFLQKNKNSDIPIDGLIVRVNNYKKSIQLDKKYKDKLGSALAIKESITFLTKVIFIEYTIGKTGKITPMVEIETVEIDAMKCNKITMYSYSFMKNSNVKIGTLISILYHGIFVFDKAVDNLGKIEEITNCFSCNSLLIEDGLNLFCINLECKERLSCSIAAFCNNIGINTLSKHTLSSLIENEIIKNISDLFTLSDKKEKINLLKGFKNKRLDNILISIDLVIKNLTAADLIFSLGIEGLGLKTCIEIQKYFYTFQNIEWSNIQLLNTNQIKTIKIFLSKIENINILISLQLLFPNL